MNCMVIKAHHERYCHSAEIILSHTVWDHKNDFCTVAMCLVPCKQSKSETSCTMLQPCQMTNLDDCTYHLPGCPVTRWPEMV